MIDCLHWYRKVLRSDLSPACLHGLLGNHIDGRSYLASSGSLDLTLCLIGLDFIWISQNWDLRAWHSEQGHGLLHAAWTDRRVELMSVGGGKVLGREDYGSVCNKVHVQQDRLDHPVFYVHVL